MNKSFNILILGGTRNARDLAVLLAKNAHCNVITSLAGRTMEPDKTFGKTRIGGFGGAGGLAQYLNENAIDLLVDATHPFATNISRNALEAEKMSGVKRLVFTRPKWQKIKGDNWIDCTSNEDAANKLPAGETTFLALGHQYLSSFSHRDDVHFVARVLDKPKAPVPLPDHNLVIAKPSHIASREADLFRRYNITNLVCRNSGGTLIYAKIEAARNLKLPIFMIKRPPSAPGTSFDNIDELAAQIILLSS